LIVRLASENPTWGDLPSKGERPHLGVGVSATAIGATLGRHGRTPAPQRAAGTWRALLGHQAAGILAGDLVPRGDGGAGAAGGAVLHRTGQPPGPPRRRDRQPRRWRGPPAGPEPAGGAGDHGRRGWLLLGDRDAKFSGSCNEVVGSEVAWSWCPRCGPHGLPSAEGWVGTVRTQCLTGWCSSAAAIWSRCSGSRSSMPAATVPTGRSGVPGQLHPPG
jgi:hypothetical protein